jgi:hypothetical protein
MAPLDPPYDPVPVSKVDLVYPARALDLMPPLHQIPSRYRQINPWSAFCTHWMFQGLTDEVQFHLKDGVDGEAAYRHLSVIVGSFAPKHEHKEAAFSYLCSLWFTKVVDDGITYEEKSA